MHRPFRILAASIATVLVFAAGSALAGTTPSYTYQGALSLDGTPVDGACDVELALYDAEEGGSVIVAPQLFPDIEVDAGRFTVRIDGWPAGVFDGERWLELAVGCPAGEPRTPLAPRQLLTSAPTAALSFTVAPGSVTADSIAPGSVQAGHVAPNSITSAQIVDGTIAGADLAPGTVTSNAIADGTIQAVDIVGGGLYSSKSQLYVVSVSGSVGGGSSQATASCHDVNDLAIAWDCDLGAVTSPLNLKATRATSWNSTTNPASVSCHVTSSSATPTSFTTRIFCIAVP